MTIRNNPRQSMCVEWYSEDGNRNAEFFFPTKYYEEYYIADVEKYYKTTSNNCPAAAYNLAAVLAENGVYVLRVYPISVQEKKQ